MGILIPLLIILFCGYIIWRAGDSFVEGSNYIGRNLSEGVKGATINAVASSMPELFIALFFLFYLKESSGFSGSLGTSLGSVIFNSLIIPSVAVYNVLIFSNKKTVPVSKKVILRDGLWLLAVEFFLIVIIKDRAIDWFDGLLLIIIYFLYLFYIFRTMKNADTVNYDFSMSEKEKISFLSAFFVFDLRAMLIGNKKLNTTLAWFVFAFSSLVIGLVCYFLVVACDWLGSEVYTVPYLGSFYGLNTPILFIALVFAAIAYITGRVDYSDYLNILYIPGTGELFVYCLALVGACIGFLWYNAYPSKVFMGDIFTLGLYFIPYIKIS